MSLLSIVLTKVRGWADPGERVDSSDMPSLASWAAGDDPGAEVPLHPRVPAFTPAYCARLAQSDPSRSLGDWA